MSRGLLKLALAEDIGAGDVTTAALVPRNQKSQAVVVAKEAGIFCGGKIAAEVFHLQDRSLGVKLHVKEGSSVKKGRIVLTVRGRTRSILEAERTALNFLGHLSGIATLTRQYVEQIRGTGAKIYDTRKTTPLWRALEKYAVQCGGGENHRFGLFDEILVKDNHWAAMKTRRGQALGPGPFWGHRKIPIEIEVRNLKELASLLANFTPDRVLLDNFSLKELKRAVSFVRGFYKVLHTRYGIRRRSPELEASGGAHLKNVRALAETGVNRISIGRLTHSAPALDLSLHLVKTWR